METTNSFGLLTMPDIAALAGLALQTMKDYRRCGLLPPEAGKVGHQPVWTREQVDEWLAAREQGPMQQLDPSRPTRAERRKNHKKQSKEKK